MQMLPSDVSRRKRWVGALSAIENEINCKPAATSNSPSGTPVLMFAELKKEHQRLSPKSTIAKALQQSFSR